jgi:hypothetical protein
MNTHLTDQKIQQLAEGSINDEKQVDSHLETCSSCRAKYTMYKLLFSEIYISPAPAIPPGFQAKVMEAAAKKRGQKIIFYYRLLCGIAMGASLTGIILVLKNIIVKGSSGFNLVFPGEVNWLEAVLVIVAIIFFYIGLNGYKTRFKKEDLLSNITF